MNNTREKEFDTTTKRIRELKGKESQESFANKIHMSQANVSKMLNGMPPSAGTLKILADLYDVSVDWLLGLSDRKSRKSIPSADNMSYADAICVLDKLYQTGAIMNGINTRTNGKNPNIIHVQDLVLRYLLESRSKVEDLDINLQDFWYKNTAEHFADKKIIEWNDIREHQFRNYVVDKPVDADIIEFIERVADKTYDTWDKESFEELFK